MDVSKKYGLEYRLLHAVTTGRPWYGDWGYKFGAGSFALTLDAYRKAVDSLSNLPLTLFFYNKRSSSSSRTRLQDVVSLYWSLSEWQLVTVRDLFRFVMGLLHDAHKQVAGCTMEKHRSAVLCPWTRDDIERVEHAMIRVLQVAGNGSRWVTRRALKGALCHSASPELLDYCLKELGGRSSKDGVVVCCRYNPETNAIEYRLEAGNNDADSSAAAADMCSNWPSEENLLRDLKFLYASLLHPETMTSSYKPQAIRDVSHSSAAKLLDCKQFVKDYESDQMVVINPFGIKISCQVELVDHPKDYTAPPPELLILPADATVSDLKFEATKAFQEVYVIFKRFQVEQLLDYGDVDDTTRVKFLVGSSGSVRVRGRCIGSYHGLHQFRMERGTDSWTVDCKCGARDDDGERMLACDACGVWQHTRCAGIRDIDVVPTKFVCDKCKCAIVGGASETTPPRPRKNNKTTAAGSGRLCKDELVVGVSGFDCLTMPFGVR